MSITPTPDDWRTRLERVYTPSADRLDAAYVRAIQRLAPLVAALMGRLQPIYEANGTITPADVQDLREYKALLTALRTEMDDFAVLARGEMDGLVEQAALVGVDTARQSALEAAGPAAPQLADVWTGPNLDGIPDLLSVVGSDEQRQTWTGYGDDAVLWVDGVLMSALEHNKSPRDVQDLLDMWLMVPYSWAESTIKTGMAWSSRWIIQAIFVLNAMIEGWIWTARLAPNTCLSCWNQHGTFHPNSEALNDHHGGYCEPKPKIIGIPVNVGDGRAAFESLPEAQQRQIMGPGLYQAWSSGKVTWNDFSKPYQDDVYGVMLRQPTLKALGL